MQGCRARLRLAAVVLFFLWFGLVALYGLLKPAPNGCTMTYMYPTYISITTDANVSSGKYGMFLYHEGWKKIDFDEHLKNLNGIPVLFIPGNGGSYKQVRSLAAESSRAFQGGPLEPTYYEDASVRFLGERNKLLIDDSNEFMFSFPEKYTQKLDWFAVDLQEEHSAMDSQILEDHTDYVVYAINKILEQYKKSKEARLKEGAEVGSSPASVILVGHSMGGFVARAAVVHPRLRKSSVETVLTLASPHQSPPVALQPSLGRLFSLVNSAWREGYEIQTTHAGQLLPSPKLSNVVVISIAGGVHDYQVRTKVASLEGIVPETNGFMISSSSVKNVWLSMDHQSILWCNQHVVQISHTLLTMINAETGQPFPSTQKRLSIFSKMLQSGVSQSLNWKGHEEAAPVLAHVPFKETQDYTGFQSLGYTSCPSSVHWPDDGLEKDLYIQSRTVTVLAMDGKRRWLDIHKLGSNGRSHFALVTNLAPCSGIRFHLWPEKNRSEVEMPVNSHVIEVTAKMVQIPAGPAPRQIEPGSQTEQAPPSAVIQLRPKEMRGFRFLTISVAPRLSVSGRPPPAASMAVGQFFDPEEGEVELSPALLLRAIYNEEDILLNEDHPLPFKLLFSVSLGLLPVTLSVTTLDCGIKGSILPNDQAGDVEHSSNRICKLRCFPPVALAWDSTGNIHIVPSLYSETVLVDSSPTSWGSSAESDKTSLLLLVDPHCSYKVSISVSLSASASRFILLYSSQIIGFMIATIFFALLRQAHAWELDLPLPSMLMAIELNLRMLVPFLLFIVLPIFVYLFLSILGAQSLPSVASFVTVSILCYLIANGCVIILILSSLFILYTSAFIHIFIRRSWQAWEENYIFILIRQIFNFSSILCSSKVVRILRGNPSIILAFLSVPLVIFVHPALGVISLLLFHAYHCHAALCSSLAASFRSQRKEVFDSESKGVKSQPGGAFDQLLPLDEMHSTSPSSGKSFANIQLELFNYRHGLLILHLHAALMFVPSLVAWLQRTGIGLSFPWFVDSVLCFGIILHGVCGWKPDISALRFPLPGILCQNAGLNLVYLLAGYYCYLYALAGAPFRAIYAMAAVGVVSFISWIVERRNRENCDGQFGKSRKHSHKH